MATGRENGVICYLRRAALLQSAGDMTDGQLLERFLSGHEEAAFEVLVRRHGPMVLGVCRRILSNAHDADDAFQAAFLVLIRKGQSLVSRQTLGNWLYGVAYHTALKARAASWKRRVRERQAAAMTKPETLPDGAVHELLPILDQELDRLPDKYREAVVLCELEGKTREEAARQIGVPVGTLSGRLTTARRMLARRLTRRGVTLSSAALAAVLTPSLASACVSPTLLCTTVKSAAATAAGQGVVTGIVSAQVVSLTQGMLKFLLLRKLKVATALLLAATVLSSSAGIFAYHATSDAADAASPESSELPGPLDLKAAAPRIAELPVEKPKEEPLKADQKPETKPSDKERLQGGWIPARAVSNGRATGTDDKKIRRTTLLFDGDDVTLADAKGSYKLDPDQEPKQLDIVLTVKDHKETVQAIYEFDRDRLFVSWIYGRERPPDFETGGREGICIVYERKKKTRP
jgi:RNA polymerase sigma-70 factor (ECF subfamily)